MKAVDVVENVGKTCFHTLPKISPKSNIAPENETSQKELFSGYVYGV